MKPIAFYSTFVLMASMMLTTSGPAAARSLRGTLVVEPQCQQCLDRCKGESFCVQHCKVRECRTSRLPKPYGAKSAQ
jgi:hypothetical protein